MDNTQGPPAAGCRPRRDVVLAVMQTLQRSENEATILRLVRDAGDAACTLHALRMILRGLGDRVELAAPGTLGMAWWGLAQ